MTATPNVPVPAPPNARREARLAREHRTMRLMLGLYCAGQHQRQVTDCPECSALLAYADARIAHCRYDPKPQCKQCPTHCYAREQRARMQEMMRYAGPRMLLHHPLLTLRHWLD